MGTGAHSPETITHAFVLNGVCWAWSMLEGEKVVADDKSMDQPQITHIDSKYIENRHGRLASGWYAVILGKGSKGDTKAHYEMCTSLLPNMEMPSESSQLKRSRGCVVGIVKVSHSLPYEMCKDSPWANGAKVCNIISEAGWIANPIPCKGNLGACKIGDTETMRLVQESARCAKLHGRIFKTRGDKKYPARDDAWKKRKAKGVVSTDEEAALRRFSDFLASTQSKRFKMGHESPA